TRRSAACLSSPDGTSPNTRMATGDLLPERNSCSRREWQLEQFGVAAERVGDDALDRDDLAVALEPQIEDLGDQADEEQEAGGHDQKNRDAALESAEVTPIRRATRGLPPGAPRQHEHERYQGNAEAE